MNIAHGIAKLRCRRVSRFAGPEPVSHVKGHHYRHASFTGLLEKTADNRQSAIHRLIVLNRQLRLVFRQRTLQFSKVSLLREAAQRQLQQARIELVRFAEQGIKMRIQLTLFGVKGFRGGIKCHQLVLRQRGGQCRQIA